MLQWVIVALAPSPPRIEGDILPYASPCRRVTHPGKMHCEIFFMSQHISNTLFSGGYFVSVALRTQTWMGLLHSEKSFPLTWKMDEGVWHSKCDIETYDCKPYAVWQKQFDTCRVHRLADCCARDTDRIPITPRWDLICVSLSEELSQLYQ